MFDLFWGDLAQLYYVYAFEIDGKSGLKGLVNSAPYLCCAVIGCW